ncbi:MAG: hypothetical protein SAJ37_03320 [Oscillatoria sp. PMC 1068.18]|nr:hypothetical protein [Oscillatoria sp. PMC 1076.18]MEC4987756.1 hypothetical protein [Oscillatoria sp. PMC 1068.18]
MTIETLPFSITVSDLTEAQGIVKFENNQLKFEFQLIGLFKSELEIKQANLAIAQIESVKLEKKLFGTYLLIRARSLKAVKEIPGTNRADIKLKLARRDLPAAEAIASKIALSISEYQLEN